VVVLVLMMDPGVSRKLDRPEGDFGGSRFAPGLGTRGRLVRVAARGRR
jgi:hypothetical protein